MPKTKTANAAKVYDPDTGRPVTLDRLITRLGIMAVAKKYGVTESCVYKWLRGKHRPSFHTVTRSIKKLI